MKRTKRVTSNIDAIDLFCGAGGLTRGLLNAGVKVRVGIDCDPVCEYPYVFNNKADFILKSITDIKGQELNKYYKNGNVRLLAGCAPCQTFSTYNYKARSAEEKDKKWFLLLEFSRLVEEILPEIVTMENVPGLEEQDVFKKFVWNLKRQGYNVCYQVVTCEDYGVPQHRHRLVLLASRLGEIKLLTPKELNAKTRTVRDVISALPPLKAGERSSLDSLHFSSRLSPLNLKRIRASKPGGSWRDWPVSLVAKCHKKDSGNNYTSVYGRMKWDEPAPTMTTQFYGFGNGRFGHPEQDRAISLREGAIIQSFPPDYKFFDDAKSVSHRCIGRMIGNAVPVILGEVIGKSIVKHVKDFKKVKTK